MAFSKRLLWGSYLAVAALAVVFFVWQWHSVMAANRPLANAAAQHFHDEFNHAEYQEIFDQADYGFTYDKTEAELAQALMAIQTKVGTVNDSALVFIRIDRTTEGRTFITAQYKTSFTRADANETFTWVKFGNSVKLYRYRVAAGQNRR